MKRKKSKTCEEPDPALYRSILLAERKAGLPIGPLLEGTFYTNRVIGELAGRILAFFNRLPHLFLIPVQPAEPPEGGREPSGMEQPSREKRVPDVRFMIQIRPEGSLFGIPPGSVLGQAISATGKDKWQAATGRPGKRKKGKGIPPDHRMLTQVSLPRIPVMDLSTSITEFIRSSRHAEQTEWISRIFLAAPPVHSFAVPIRAPGPLARPSPEILPSPGSPRTEVPTARIQGVRGGSAPGSEAPEHRLPDLPGRGKRDRVRETNSPVSRRKTYGEYLFEIQSLIQRAFTGGTVPGGPARHVVPSGLGAGAGKSDGRGRDALPPLFSPDAPGERRERGTIFIPALTPRIRGHDSHRAGAEPVHPLPGRGEGDAAVSLGPSPKPFTLVTLFGSNPPVHPIREAIRVTESLRANRTPSVKPLLPILQAVFPEYFPAAMPPVPGRPGPGTPSFPGKPDSLQRRPVHAESPSGKVLFAAPGHPAPPPAGRWPTPGGEVGHGGSALPLSFTGIVRISRATQAAFAGISRPVLASLQSPQFRIFKDRTSVLVGAEKPVAGWSPPARAPGSREPVERSGSKPVKFENIFNISVNVSGQENESDLRDLGRKIGRILSDELQKYGRYPWR